VLKARDLVIEELVCECQKETGEVSKDSSSKKEGAIVRTTNLFSEKDTHIRS